MQYDEKTVKAALKLILDVVAEDKHEIKELTEDNKNLKAENRELMTLANEYIQKCDTLTTENVRLLALREPVRPVRRSADEK